MKRYPLFKVVHDIYKNNGIPGFWRGMSASLMGLGETAVFFVLYEKFKAGVTPRIEKYRTKWLNTRP